MQVIVDQDYLELLKQDNKVNDEDKTEYNPFTGKRCPVTSMDEIKKILSLPKEERKKMIQRTFVRYI